MLPLSLFQERALARSAELDRLEARALDVGATRRAAVALRSPQLRARSWRVLELGPLLGEDPPASDRPLWQGSELGLRWAPPRPGARSAALEGAAHDEASVRQQRVRAGQLLRAEVERIYLSATAADAAAAVLRVNSALTAELLQAARTRMQAGAATRIDLSLAELAHVQSLDEVRSAERKGAACRARLGDLAGLPADEAWQLDPALLRRPCRARDHEVLQSATASALRQRPEVQGLQEEVAAAAADQAALRWSLLPWPRFVELAYRFGNERTADLVEAGLAFDLIPKAASSAQRGRLAARHAERAAQLRLTSAIIQQEVRAAALALEQAEAALRASSATVGLAETAVAGLRAAAARGEGDLPAVLALAGRATDLRRRHTDPTLECKLAEIDLRLALGSPAEPEQPTATPPRP